jgi:hypothetical protein
MFQTVVNLHFRVYQNTFTSRTNVLRSRIVMTSHANTDEDFGLHMSLMLN